jgi:hypothetical protein
MNGIYLNINAMIFNIIMNHYCPFCYITENSEIAEKNNLLRDSACEKRYIYYKCRSLINAEWNKYVICPTCKLYLGNLGLDEFQSQVNPTRGNKCIYCKIELNDNNKCTDKLMVIFDNNICKDHCG